MVSKKITDALNEQINKELYSGYLYLSMATYVYDKGLNGLGNWFKAQAKEEQEHAMKIFDYLVEQGARVLLGKIDKPEIDFKSVVGLFEETLAHEKKVTKLINSLVDLAKKENDHATEIFLQWFVTEQIEEEANASDILNKLNLCQAKGNGLLMIDAQLGKRGAE